MESILEPRSKPTQRFEARHPLGMRNFQEHRFRLDDGPLNGMSDEVAREFALRKCVRSHPHQFLAE
jgi:hypothetical protein